MCNRMCGSVDAQSADSHYDRGTDRLPMRPVPRELGGLRMSLPEVCHEQRRLAYRAPATAFATKPNQ
jgi:hypothetical protein